MKRTIILALLAILIYITGSCSIKLSFTGASISPDVKTATIIPFPNMATMVSPILATTFNDELTNKIQRETRLQMVREGGDVVFEGQIIDYRSDPINISGVSEYATANRLTIAVRVKFTNNKEPNYSFNARNFSAYADYPANDMLVSVEGTLIPEIVEKIIEDIFNAAFSQWD